ncbi:glycine cleavage system protein GcvH [Polyangium jinanense]|uniref:Glycine cleavage system H protein n=1 Tax=Polyangium jinanense TaxID=2829994 RepID=A0A9X3X0G2_9BACT|nr:glycine cleavage system protein GcvH [Polyangium jinanense]MDC3954222.1 glycine cleavage system protein GcvH [Polyangium jinanense]MDC3981822.1 glycine cleavage system protein GcvH [Polyangium jinanense]
MSSNDVRSDRRYSKDHEWAKEENGRVLVGITAYAVELLGDITLVNLDVKVGETVTQGKAFGTIESVKSLSDLFAPVSGKVVQINQLLEQQPEKVNEDCYDLGWMIAVEPSDPNELNGLLDVTAYTELLKTAGH